MTAAPDQELREAARAGDLEALNDALGRGAAVNARDDLDGAALNLAAESGYLPIVTRLLEAGADIESQDGADRTPLMSAVLAGHAGVADLLLRRGARVTRDLLMSLQTKVRILEENAELGMVKPEGAQAWREFFDALVSKWKEQDPAD